MAKFMDQRKNNDPKYPGDSAILQKINDFTSLKANLQIQAQKRAESQGQLGDKTIVENQNLTKNLNDLINHHITDNLQLSGVPSMRDLLNYFSEASAGTRQTTDTEVQQRAQQLGVYRNYIYQQAHQQNLASAPVIGQDKYEQTLNAAMSPIDTYIKLANDKENGPAVFHLQQVKAIKADDEYNMLMNKDRGAAARQLLTARGILGDQGLTWYLPKMIEQGVDKKFGDLFNQEGLAAIAPLSDARGQPIQRTMLDAVQHGKKVGVPDIEEYVGKISGWLEQMADPRMPAAAKDNMVKWAFNKPGVMDELAMEYRDPVSGQTVPGKYRALNLIASDKILSSVAETAKAHPENYEMAKSWTEGEFGKLFRTDLQNLSQLTKNPELKFHYSYDDTTKHYGLVDNTNKPITRDSRFNVINPNPAYHAPEYKGYINNSLDILDRVNSGIDRIKAVHLHDPKGDTAGSVDKYILQTLQTATGGAFPGSTLTGATADMAKALVKTLKPSATPEEINNLILGK